MNVSKVNTALYDDLYFDHENTRCTPVVLEGGSVNIGFGNNPIFISGGLDCLIVPQIMKNLCNKTFEAISLYVKKEVNLAKHLGLSVISISIPTLGKNESERMCRILEMSHVFPELLWMVNISHSPPNVARKAFETVAGKPFVNFCTLEQTRMKQIFPLVCEFSATVIIQLLDEQGIPHSIDERKRMLERLIKEAEAVNLPRENILVDILTPPLGTIKSGTRIAIETIRLLKDENFHTITWLNNVSSGFRSREKMNAAYLSILLAAGIDAVVLDPNEYEVLKTAKSIIELF